VIKELAHILTSPINQAILVILCVWLLSFKLERVRKMAKAFYISSLIWIYLCSQPFFSYLLMEPIESRFPPIKASDKVWQSSELIWVLACNHYNKEMLPDVSRWNECSLQRLVHTYMMYKEKPTNIVLTGGDFSSEGGFNYSDKAKAFLIKLGVKEEHIQSIPKGSNTQEELNALVTVIEAKNIAVVSSASHGLRLSTLLDQQSSLNYLFIPVEHLNPVKLEFYLGLPKIASIEKSRRAFYTYLANLEVLLSDNSNKIQ
jgi:uncharacterized SAM-binding protein YcdF (DUF218 family)